jgi:hypothetical protein
MISHLFDDAFPTEPEARPLEGCLPPQAYPLSEKTQPSSRAESLLNVMVLYQDRPTRQWAGEVCERLAGLVGHEALRTTCWNLDDLSEPGVLAGAVSTALRADIIVTAVHAAHGLPLPFYVWAGSWFPYRRLGTGVLVALIGLPERMTPQMDRARDYLRALAKKARLDFLIEERKIASETPRSALGFSSKRSAATARA